METLESLVKSWCPDHYVVHGACYLDIPGLGRTRFSPFKLVFRSAIVIITTLIVSFPCARTLASCCGSYCFLTLHSGSCHFSSAQLPEQQEGMHSQALRPSQCCALKNICIFPHVLHE